MRLIPIGLIVAAVGSIAGAKPAPTAPPPPISLARPAIPSSEPRGWITPQDYPLLALQDGRGGAVGFTVAVGADGAVKSCRVTAPSGSPDLDEATCKVVKQKAIFHPALNPNGAPVAGTYSARVQWKAGFDTETYEPVLARQLVPKQRVLTYFVEVDGSIKNCVELEDGKPTSGNQRYSLCTFDAQTIPYLDQTGRPVRKFVTQKLIVTVEDAPLPPGPVCAPDTGRNCGR